jgi:chemotaxis protein methyltransferase WspC
LIEDVVVSETWFFRNHEALTTFVQLLTTAWPVAAQDHPRRVLSVPCATGEEPYSIAIALAEHGFTRAQVQIDAMDVSWRALAWAERGVYTPNAFRGDASQRCAPYMRPVPHGMQIVPDLRSWVHFSHGNMLASSFHPRASSYDVIFCRNLLIYLECPAQKHVLEMLHRLLTPNGYLFVGPAEAPLVAEYGFRVMAHTMSFVCQKVPRGIAIPVTDVQSPARSIEKPPANVTVPHEHRPSIRSHRDPTSHRQDRPVSRSMRSPDHPSPLKAAGSPAAQPSGDLETAHRLADAGRLTEAADVCTAYLRDYGTSAEAFYLLGLIQDARGVASEAVMYYRKTLFLDPNHANASAQLAIHAQRSGDRIGAERLRARLQRIERRGKL